MRPIVVGGTGFTGERVVHRLADRGISFSMIARATSNTEHFASRGYNVIPGDLDQPASLAKSFADHDVLIFVASMGFGHIPSVLQAAVRAGITRGIFVSTTAVLTRLPVRSKPIRAAAERAVRDSSLEWSIIRPTMIYGSDRDRNMCRLLRHLKTWKLAPIPGRGAALQQPVHVDDVADAIVAASLSQHALRKDYIVSGARAMSLRDIIKHAAQAVGVHPMCVPIPIGAATASLRCLEKLGVRLPLRAEQLHRLNEDKAFNHESATADLGFAPRCFSQGIREEAELLGLAARP